MQIVTARLHRLQQRTLETAEAALSEFRPRPNPTPARFATLSPQRQFMCRRYSLCLDVAFGSDWHGFTCSECSAYVRLSREEERADIEAMVRLLATFSGKRARADRVDSTLDDDEEIFGEGDDLT